MTLLKHAFRQLCLRPGLSAVVIAMLAVGIGATTAIFALFHQVLVQPLPVPEPDRLVNIVRTVSGQGFSYPMVRDFEADVRGAMAEQRVLAGIAAHWPFTANVAHGERVESLLATYVSGDYFAVLSLQPSLGRLIGPQDQPRAGESAVVVLSHDYWTSRFASDPTGAAAVAFGLLPALRTARTGTAAALKGHASQAVGGRGAARLRGALATVQIAFSMVLLVLGGLFAQSLLNVARIDLGIEVDSLLSFSVAPQLNGYDAERAALLHGEIGRAMAAQPSVIGVATAAWPVLAGRDFHVNLRDGEVGVDPMPADFNVVAPGFFATLGIPLLAGREFATTDTADSPRVAIVTERFVRQYGGALGTRLRAGGGDYEIVGIVANAAAGQVKTDALAQFFVPLDGNHSLGVGDTLTYYVRTSLDPDALLTAIPRTVAAVDPTLPVDNLMTLRRQVQENVFVDRDGAPRLPGAPRRAGAAAANGSTAGERYQTR